MSDILQHSTFDPRELERERAVVLQEIGQAHDTPDDIIFDLFQERAFPDQPMGRPVLGRAEIIRTIDRETVASYLRRNYAAPGMLLVAAGNLEHGAIVDLAQRAFAQLPGESAAKSEPARYVGGDMRQERDFEQVHILLGFPGFAFADNDYYAASVVSTALGGGMSSRLFQEIREKRGLVYSIYSFTHAYSDGGVFGVYAGTGEDEAAELMPALCNEIRRLGDGLLPAELERARAQLKAGLLMSLEGTGARCEQQAAHMLVFGRPLDMQRTDRSTSTRWTQDAVVRVAHRLFAAPPTLTALGPIGRIESYDRLVERSRRVRLRRAARAAAASSAPFPPPSAIPASACCCARPSDATGANGRELRGESRAFLTPWEPTWSADALTRDAFHRRLARYAADWRQDQGYSFLLFRLEDDALLGGIGLTNVRRGVAESASLGYWTGERHARQGYMTEGLQLMLAFAFQRARLHRVEAACLPHNEASRGLLDEERLPRGRLCARISLHRRQMAGPRPLRHAPRRMGAKGVGGTGSARSVSVEAIVEPPMPQRGGPRAGRHAGGLRRTWRRGGRRRGDRHWRSPRRRGARR